MYCIDCGTVHPRRVAWDGIERLVCPGCERTLLWVVGEGQFSRHTREETAALPAARGYSHAAFLADWVKTTHELIDAEAVK